LKKTSISEKNSSKTPFFSPLVLYHASNNTTFPNIAWDGCMGRLPPQILGGVPQAP